jgi:hypothetical protein
LSAFVFDVSSFDCRNEITSWDVSSPRSLVSSALPLSQSVVVEDFSIALVVAVDPSALSSSFLFLGLPSPMIVADSVLPSASFGVSALSLLGVSRPSRRAILPFTSTEEKGWI